MSSESESKNYVLLILEWGFFFAFMVATHVYFPVEVAMKNHIESRELHFRTTIRCYGHFVVSICKTEPTFDEGKSYVGIFNNFMEI